MDLLFTGDAVTTRQVGRADSNYLADGHCHSQYHTYLATFKMEALVRGRVYAQRTLDEMYHYVALVQVYIGRFDWF